jgi:hypothetical protein
MAAAQAVPVLISSNNTRSPLERIHLGKGTYHEKWLQELIHDYPVLLPVSNIEPSFGELIAAAREVPCPHGSIDNVFITPTGNIVVAETKLWRNSQMRREVVAQALDYVAALSAMSYTAFEAAVARGHKAPEKLYDLVRDHPDAYEEAEFEDAVALNLRRGRMVVMVLGDGIRAETEALSGLLQSHAGSHFTFALVELAIWRNAATGDILAIPNTLTRTLTIERGIVRVEQGVAVVHPIPKDVPPHPESISSAEFWEKIAQYDPALPGHVRSFLAALEPLGVYPDFKASLNIKADVPDRESPVNFGYITRDGRFLTRPAAWGAPEQAWRSYFETLAKLINGKVVMGAEKYVSTANGSTPRIWEFLPQHQDAFVAAIQTMLHALRDDEL